MKKGYEKYCRFYRCEEKECWYNGCKCEGERLIIKEPKQETLEEAAQRFLELWVKNNSSTKSLFIEGAKWQQERSYSNEDMLESFMAGIKCESKYGKNFEQFIKQFKKK